MTFIIVSQDLKTIELIINEIKKIVGQDKQRKINVVISSSYQKLHTISGGIF